MIWDLVAEASLPGWIFLGFAVLLVGLFLRSHPPKPLLEPPAAGA